MNRPSVDECIQGFERILNKINPQQLIMLRAHYHSRGRAATMRELATAAGYADFKMANLQYGNLAKRLYQTIGYPKPKSARSGNEYWILGLGEFIDRRELGLESDCVMRPEIVSALERLGIVKPLAGSVAMPDQSNDVKMVEDERERPSPSRESSARKAETPEISKKLRSEADSKFEKYERDPDMLKRPKRILIITGKGESANVAHERIITGLDGGRLLDRGRIEDFSLLTQNVDGSNDLVEFHGDVNEARCLSCGHSEPPENVAREEARWHECPKCRDHGTVVLCRRMLDDDELQNAREKAMACEYCIVAGSSDVSSSALRIAEIAKQAGAYLAEINEEETELSEIADEVVRLHPVHLLPFIDFLRHELREHDQADSADLTTDSNIQSLKTSGAQPARVDFIRSEEFPFLNRLGMVFAPGLSLDEGEAGRLQLGDVASEDDITLVRLQVPADKAVPDSMTEVVTMAANFGRALRQGEFVIVHCKDNQAFVSLTAACIAIAATDAKISAIEAIQLVREAHPGAIESEAQAEFVAEFEKEWREVMAKRGAHYLLYWQERSVQEHAANDLPLDVVASNGLFGVEQGDTLWIVTLTQEREFLLAGRMVVGEIVEYEEAIRRMPDAGLWQAEYYAFLEPGTEEFLRLVPLQDIAEELRFDGENDRLTIRDGKINPQQLRKRRKLTPESAELIASIWEESAVITNPEELVTAWRQVVEANPEDPEAHYNLGVALDEVGRSEEAIGEYQETIRLDPNYFPALYNLGNYLLRSQRFDEAIEMFNRAILVDGDLAPVHFMLGVAYFESGRFEDAIAATRQGLEVDPDDEGAYYNIAYWTFVQGDYQGALARCDDVIAHFPFYTSPHVLKGMCFRELGELENEIQAYKDAVAIKVDDEGAFIINFTAVFFLGAAWERKITGSDQGIEYIQADNYVNLEEPTHQFCFAMGHLAQGEMEYADQWIDGLRTSAPNLARRLERAMTRCSTANVGCDRTEILAEVVEDASSESVSGKNRSAICFAADDESFTAKNIPDLYKQVLQHLVLTGKLEEVKLPIASGPKRYLIAREPIHPTGQNFMVPVEYQGYFMEAHNNRIAAISQLRKLLDRMHIPSRVLSEINKGQHPSYERQVERTVRHTAHEVKMDGAGQEVPLSAKAPCVQDERADTPENPLAGTEEHPARAASLKIVTFNIRHGGGNRVARILEYLQSLNADVVVLTEFRENVNAPIFRSKLGDGGLLHFAAASTDSPTQNGVCIFSRYQFLPRIYSEVLTADSHRLISAHFGLVSIYGVYFPQKSAKAPLFHFLLEGKYRPANPNVIVIGDFNTGLRRVDETGSSFFCADLFSALPDAGLVDSWRSRNPGEKVFSWFSNVGNGFRIDHVFSNPSADGKIQRVYYDHAPRETDITDHSAMVVEYCELQ